MEPVSQLVANLASPAKGKLHLLRVINFSAHYVGWGSQTPNDLSIEEQAREKAETYLHIIEDRLCTNVKDGQVLSTTSSVKVNTDVAGAIVEEAERSDDDGNGYDIIAMATHGRGGVTRWAMGSVTERVLDGTKLPLLVVRSPEVHHPPMQMHK